MDIGFQLFSPQCIQLFDRVKLPPSFAASRTVFIPKSTAVDDQGRIVRSPDALRPPTSCNCDCEMLTSALWVGLRQYSVSCFHPRLKDAPQPGKGWIASSRLRQRPLSNARVCQGMLVFSSRILHALGRAFSTVGSFEFCKKAGLPALLQLLRQRIYNESTTAVGHAGQKRVHFAMARRVRQGCPARGVLPIMAFDPIFRWLNDVIIHRIRSVPECLHPTACACADRSALAAPSFRTLMTVIASAFRVTSPSDRCTRIKPLWTNQRAPYHAGDGSKPHHPPRYGRRGHLCAL